MNVLRLPKNVLLKPAQLRRIHATCVRKDIVGPPDQVSNLRPVIYDDAPILPPDGVRHPYSLREFTGDTREYHWKMQRQQLDAYNHEFWTDSNTRFEAAKQAYLDSLPSSCTLEDQETALSVFYSKWVKQETARQQQYCTEWRKRNWSNIMLGARVKYQMLWSKITRSSHSSLEDARKD
ncbi:hypothetical protein QCA50_003013 [Cerrena zonata]|uniref:Apoptogenic protein 1, mitochondrial n=1 Tax=Cerrena zonata TaxID=2478898 RepID=A0AAW0GVH1_9APHY